MPVLWERSQRCPQPGLSHPWGPRSCWERSWAGEGRGSGSCRLLPTASQWSRAYLEWGWVGSGSAVSRTGPAPSQPSWRPARHKELLLPAGALAHAGEGSLNCQEREPGSWAPATACGCRFLPLARASHVSPRPEWHRLETTLCAGYMVTFQPWTGESLTPTPCPAPAPAPDLKGFVPKHISIVICVSHPQMQKHWGNP